MRTISIALTAGQRLQLELVGNYFHLLESTGGVDIDFVQNQAIIGTAKDMEFGFFAKPAGGFTALGFTSATGQTIKITVGMGDGGYNRTTGSVQISGNQGAFAQGRVSLTNVNQQIIAANAARKYLLIQNNDAAAVMRVMLDGNAATPTNGMRIQAGGTLELSGYQSSAAINCIMETATAAAGNVEFCSG